MNRNVAIVAALLSLVLIGGGVLAYQQSKNTTSADPAGVSSNAEDIAVRAVVTEFGTKLKMVSLLAPTADRRAAMQSAYGAYVVPELLEKWAPEGAEALGRYTSSPSPDRITVGEVRKDGARYVVEGTVVEVTGSNAEVAATYPVTLMLESRDGTWMIVDAVKGAYSEIPHTQSITGFWECLPHKNTNGPQTLECALGIAVDQSDGHFAIDTSLMSTYPVDFPTGTKVRVTGTVTPASQLSSVQKYDIDGIIRATKIERVP